jgi:hypothetical protein
MVIGHVNDPCQQQIGARLSTFANDEGQHQPPNRSKGYPNPGITIGLIIELGKRQVEPPPI